MWTKTQELAFDIMMGLRKGLKLVRGIRRSMTEEEQQRVSEFVNLFELRHS